MANMAPEGLIFRRQSAIIQAKSIGTALNGYAGSNLIADRRF
jgi:hypothetical protein